MLPSNRIPAHPGEILLEEFIKPLGLTQVQLANELDIPLQRLNEVVRGKRGVTANTAWLLARRLGNSPQFWLNLQSAYDLATERAHMVEMGIMPSPWGEDTNA